MNFLKYFKIFGLISCLIFGLFFTISTVSAFDECRCEGTNDETGEDEEWVREGTTCDVDDDCIVECEEIADREGYTLDISTCVPEAEGEITDPEAAGRAFGECRCTAGAGEGLSRTIEVSGITMADLERNCRTGCESYGLSGDRRVTFSRCGNPAARRSEEGERLCVAGSTATPPGEEVKTETETRAAPSRDCDAVNHDCMTRFSSQRHIFFSNAECYCCGECTLDDFTNVFIGAADYLFGILGALALLFFIYGGVTWLTAGGSAERVEKGRKILIGAVIGIAIAVGAWFLIDLLQQALGVKGEFRL